MAVLKLTGNKTDCITFYFSTKFKILLYIIVIETNIPFTDYFSSPKEPQSSSNTKASFFPLISSLLFLYHN